MIANFASKILFPCGSDVARICAALIVGRAGHTSIERTAVRLLAAAKRPQAQRCVKGRFFDRMQAKLNQLTADGSNELVQIICRPSRAHWRRTTMTGMI